MPRLMVGPTACAEQALVVRGRHLPPPRSQATPAARPLPTLEFLTLLENSIWHSVRQYPLLPVCREPTPGPTGADELPSILQKINHVLRVDRVVHVGLRHAGAEVEGRTAAGQETKHEEEDDHDFSTPKTDSLTLSGSTKASSQSFPFTHT